MQKIESFCQVQISEPKLYVIYTGEWQERLAEISLSKEFFGGRECAVDVKIKMIYDGTVSKEIGESDIRNHSYLQRQKCIERVFGKQGKRIMMVLYDKYYCAVALK